MRIPRSSESLWATQSHTTPLHVLQQWCSMQLYASQYRHLSLLHLSPHVMHHVTEQRIKGKHHECGTGTDTYVGAILVAIIVFLKNDEKNIAIVNTPRICGLCSVLVTRCCRPWVLPQYAHSSALILALHLSMHASWYVASFLLSVSSVL